MHRSPKILMLAGLLLILAACATFYTKTSKIQTQIAAGNFEQADKLLDQDKKWPESVHRVLYFMNRGVVSFMLGDYQKSADFLDRADLYIEDYRKSLGTEALALVSNPMVKPYRPEDFEAIMVNFYKALDFLEMGNMEAALVETRRINIRLQQLNDKYKDHKNKYQKDAFALNMMGMIYDAAHDYNNAFIAYRNALETYQQDYTTLFGLGPPAQLKEDLLRSAQNTGFENQVQQYEEEFNLKVPKSRDDSEGELVFLWLNGLGPIKWEWSLTLSNMGFSDGFLTLANPELGLVFPLYVGNRSADEQAAFKNLSFLRIAFPKYVERPPIFTSARLKSQDKEYTLEMAEDINQIAFQSLHDRMMRELGNSLLRMATKRALEEAARSKNENLGTILSIVNAMTEKADTRNWQSLPYSVSYTRIVLPPGRHNLELHLDGKAQRDLNITVDIQEGETTFYTYHTLDSNFNQSNF